MALPTKTITWDNLNSSTTMPMEKVVQDTYFNQNALYKYLYGKKKPYRGGRSFTEPMFYDEGNATDYTGYQTLPNTDKEIITTGVFNIAHITTDITIAQTDMKENAGNAKVFDLLEAKFENAKATIMKYVSTQTFGSQTAYPKIVGLGTICPTSANTYAGIDATVYTTTDCNRYDATSLATLTNAKMQSAWGEVSEGDEHPDIIVCPQAVYDKIWASADGYQRRKSDDAQYVGIDHQLVFNGVPVLVDKNSALTGVLYMLNTKYLFLRAEEIEFTDWLMNTTQMAKVKKLSIALQLVCNNRKWQQVMYNLT